MGRALGPLLWLLNSFTHGQKAMGVEQLSNGREVLQLPIRFLNQSVYSLI